MCRMHTTFPRVVALHVDEEIYTMFVFMWESTMCRMHTTFPWVVALYVDEEIYTMFVFMWEPTMCRMHTIFPWGWTPRRSRAEEAHPAHIAAPSSAPLGTSMDSASHPTTWPATLAMAARTQTDQANRPRTGLVPSRTAAPTRTRTPRTTPMWCMGAKREAITKSSSVPTDRLSGKLCPKSIPPNFPSGGLEVGP